MALWNNLYRLAFVAIIKTFATADICSNWWVYHPVLTHRKQRNLVQKVVPSPRTIRRAESRNTLTVYCIHSRASVWVSKSFAHTLAPTHVEPPLSPQVFVPPKGHHLVMRFRNKIYKDVCTSCWRPSQSVWVCIWLCANLCVVHLFSATIH